MELISQFLASNDVCAPQYMKKRMRGVPTGHDRHVLVTNRLPTSVPMKK